MKASSPNKLFIVSQAVLSTALSSMFFAFSKYSPSYILPVCGIMFAIAAVLNMYIYILLTKTNKRKKNNDL